MGYGAGAFLRGVDVLVLLALGVAFAREPSDSAPVAPLDPPRVDGGMPAGQGGGGQGSNSQGRAGRDAPPPAQPAWETKLFFEPQLGGFAYVGSGGTTTGVSVGAQAGLRYWQTRRERPRWRGEARVAGAYVLSTGDTSGMDFRVGNFIGPYWKHFGVETGPDVFWNQYEFGATRLDGSLGLAWPLTAKAWTDDLSAWAGVEPAWLADETRRVDWSEATLPGFGHEFTYRAGVGATLGGLSLSLGYSYKITAGGDQHGLSVGVNI